MLLLLKNDTEILDTDLVVHATFRTPDGAEPAGILVLINRMNIAFSGEDAETIWAVLKAEAAADRAWRSQKLLHAAAAPADVPPPPEIDAEFLDPAPAKPTMIRRLWKWLTDPCCKS